MSSGTRSSRSGRRSSRPLTRMTGGEPVVRWRSDALRSAISARNASIESTVVSMVITPLSASGRVGLRVNFEIECGTQRVDADGVELRAGAPFELGQRVLD